MNAAPVTVRRLGIGIAVVAALLTSACAAGQKAATSEEKPSLDGTNADVGSMNLRGLALTAPTGASPYYATGSDVSMRLVLVNSGSQADKLTSISSPAVSDWGAFASTSDAAAVTAAASASSSPSSPSSATAGGSSSVASIPGTGTSGTSTSSSTRTGTTKSGKTGTTTTGSTSIAAPSVGAPSPGPTAVPLPTPMRSITIAAGARVSWGVPEAKGVLLLLHTTKRLYPGSTIPITFTFADAGSVTVQVPVALSSAPRSSVVPPAGTETAIAP